MSEDQDARQFGTPSVHRTVFVAHGTSIIGDVQIGEHASIWFNCVLRGDVQRIVIGARTNIQDGSILHGTTNGSPTLIGSQVTVGPGFCGFRGTRPRQCDRAYRRHAGGRRGADTW
jgi:carbonic anhydrase/acetyltransferase-like protein (isoleucine patch superfamily)